MKLFILAATGLSLLAVSASAEDATLPPPPAPAADAGPADAAPPPPPPGPKGDKGPRAERGPKDRGPRGDGPPPPPPSKAASFRIASGPNKIDVKCADDEPMKACSDIVMMILDKAGPGFFAAPRRDPDMPPPPAPDALPAPQP